MKQLNAAAEHATPFVIAFASVNLATVNALAALVLTLIGIAHAGRKLWLSFKPRKKRRDE